MGGWGAGEEARGPHGVEGGEGLAPVGDGGQDRRVAEDHETEPEGMRNMGGTGAGGRGSENSPPPVVVGARGSDRVAELCDQESFGTLRGPSLRIGGETLPDIPSPNHPRLLNIC